MEEAFWAERIRQSANPYRYFHSFGNLAVIEDCLQRSLNTLGDFKTALRLRKDPAFEGMRADVERTVERIAEQIDILRRQRFALTRGIIVPFEQMIKTAFSLESGYVLYKPKFDDENEVLYLLSEGGS